jgi:hypothetical protein
MGDDLALHLLARVELHPKHQHVEPPSVMVRAETIWSGMAAQPRGWDAGSWARS